MLTRYLKKFYMHVMGVALIAMGMTLDSLHGLGQHPMKQATEAIGKLLHVDYWIIFFLLCLLFDLIWFIKFKKKDVFFTLIETIALIFTARLLIYQIFPLFIESIDNYTIRIILFIISLNITTIGIVLLFKSHLSMFAIEQAIVLVTIFKPFKNFSLSQARVIIDLIFYLIVIVVSVFMINFGNIINYWATLGVVFLGGPTLALYLFIYDKLFPHKIHVDKRKNHH